MRNPPQLACRSAVSGVPAKCLLLVACVLAGACASGGSTTTAGGTAPPIVPRSSGFDGGTQVSGGFTNAASSVRDSVVSRPPAAVWAVMPAVFETLGIETPTFDSRSYVIGNPGSRVARIAGSTRLSNYLDCGIGILGPNADRYEVTLQLIVQLASYPIGATIVRTTLDAYARPRDTSGEPIHCASQRTLERQINELIGLELSGAGPRAGSAVTVRGRVPVEGDHLRLECLTPQGQLLRVGEGLFLGADEGDLHLNLGPAGGSLAFPAANVRRIQVRERQSATKVAGFIGAVLGIVGGGIQGRSYYDPDAESHYPSGVFMTTGALLGGIAGYLAGRIAGSFIPTHVWHDAPENWARQYTVTPVQPIEAGAAGGAVAPSTPCPGSDSGG